MPELHIGRHIIITTKEDEPDSSDYVLRVYPTHSMLLLEEHPLPAEVFEVLAKWHKSLNTIDPDKNQYFKD